MITLMKRKFFPLVFCILLAALLVACGSDAPAHSSETTESDTPYAVDIRLGSGHHTAGIDFPAGTYDLKAIQWCGTVRSSNEAISCYMGTSEYNTDGQNLYTEEVSGIELPAGTVLSLAGGVDLRMVCPDADPTPLQPRNQEISEQVTLSAGRYTAGTDFPAGTYNFTVLKGVGNVESSNMHEYGINDVMGTTWRMAEGFGFCEQDYANISLPEGTILSLSGIELLMIPSE